MDIKNYEQFINEKKVKKMKDVKYIEMTGSPKESGFATKAIFLQKLQNSGNGNFEQEKMTKRDNVVDFLITDDLGSTSNKMKLANELGIEIMTYEDMADTYGFSGE